jgi:RimJ/RimL family protein N-acetyltransferase
MFASSRAAVPVPRPHTLETDRLILMPLEGTDVPDFHRILAEPDVRRFLLDDLLVSREWVEEEVRRSHERFERDGCGLWAVRLRGDERLIGFSGYRSFFDPPELQLLYGLDPRSWGQGIATEAARAVLRHGIDCLGLEEVRAATDRPNHASIAVLARLGMRLEREAVEDGRDTLFYVFDRHSHSGSSRP